jgi:hypothetical protein
MMMYARSDENRGKTASYDKPTEKKPWRPPVLMVAALQDTEAKILDVAEVGPLGPAS